MKTCLQFSGGKDSLACLYMLEPKWSELIVAWVNTGFAFPETLAQMERVSALVPDFRVIHTEQSIGFRGFPVDLIPAASTPVGVLLQPGSTPYQSRYDCCAYALWKPMADAMKAWGVEQVIRGQKKADRRRAPLQDGAKVDGIEYCFPLADWTDAEVMAYLVERGAPIPANYLTMRTGLDCWNCTAYLDEQGGKAEYMRDNHPEKHAFVQAQLERYRETIAREVRCING